MKKKYFFFDYDGTLSNRRVRGDLLPSSQLALNKLQENGHFVALATGRAHYKARPQMEALNLHNMVCNGGGGIVVDNVLVKNKPLDQEKVKILLRQAEEKNIGYLVALDDNIDAYGKNDLFNKQCGGRKEPTNLIIDPNFNFEKYDCILKAYLSIAIEDEDILPAIKDNGRLRLEQEYLTIQHDNKKAGIIEMMKYLNAPIEDVVVFGDDINDLVMFDKTWTSIAMGNAIDILKDVADYVTDNCWDDGVYKACKEFNWI